MELLTTLFFFFLGAVIASFTTVIAERVYTGQSWMRGRSRCNSCRRTLSFIDLVPVFSLIAFRGRCRTCRAKIPLSYSLFEAVLGIIFLLAYLKMGLSLAFAVFLVACTILLFIVVYDLRHTIVTWASSIVLLLLSGLFAVLQTSMPQDLFPIVVTAAIIGLFFFLMHALSGGKWMGLGDAPVAFALSLLVGGAAIPGILFSFWIGAVVGIVILFIRRGGPTMGIEIPFVPFLAAGYLLAFFTQWNPLLLHFY